VRQLGAGGEAAMPLYVIERNFAELPLTPLIEVEEFVPT
jgi:hypothetical protein